MMHRFSIVAYRHGLLLGLVLFSIWVPSSRAQETPQNIPPNFATDKLVAWCIVPFDAKQRGPVERAAMLNVQVLETPAAN